MMYLASNLYALTVALGLLVPPWLGLVDAVLLGAVARSARELIVKAQTEPDCLGS